MTNNSQSTLTWKPALFRVTLFTKPMPSIAHTDWWKTVTNHDPESTKSQFHGSVHTAEGVFEGGQLTLQTHPQRIDWVYSILPSPDEIIVNMPTLGDFDSQVNLFTRNLNPWFSMVDQLEFSRLAFGAELFQGVKTPIEGYESLTSFLNLGVKIDSDTSDFVYQINRKRKSNGSIADLIINRLSKWSVATLQVQIQDSVLAVQDSILNLTPVYANRLELDINTSPEFQNPIYANQVSTLIQEMISLGREIAKNGDVI